MTRSAPTTRREVVVFLALVYTLQLAIALGLPHAHVNVLMAVLAPTLVTALAIAIAVPRGARRAAWRAIGLRRSGKGAWLAAVLIPIGLMAGSYGVALLVGAGHLRAGYRPDADVVAGLIGTTLFVLGEEIGWRGFLLPRVRVLTGDRRGTVATGFLHGCSHLPLILLATTYDVDGPRWFVAPTVVATITAAGVFYAWLWDRTGSPWAVSVGHGAANTAFDVGAAAVAGAPLTLAYVTGESGVATLAVVAALALWLMRQDRRPADASDCPPSWPASSSSPAHPASARAR